MLKLLFLFITFFGASQSFATKVSPCINGVLSLKDTAFKRNEFIEVTLTVTTSCGNEKTANIKLSFPKAIILNRVAESWTVKDLDPSKPKSFSIAFKITQPGEFTFGASVENVEGQQTSGSVLYIHASSDRVTINSNPPMELNGRVSAAERPASCSSPWFIIDAEIPANALPKGVIALSRDNLDSRYPFRKYLSLKNNGDKALIFFDSSLEKALLTPEFKKSDTLHGTEGKYLDKLQSGKAFHYFENGAPMAGKENLKGWLSQEGVDQYQIPFPAPAAMKIGPARPAGVRPPPNETFELRAFYEGEIIKIPVNYNYNLNSAYDPTVGLCDPSR